MIVDSSAVVAILKPENEGPQFRQCLLSAVGQISISAANYFESAVVIDSNRNDALSERLDGLISDFGIAITPVTQEQMLIARQAYRQFGKGSGHPAKLNFGDCFAYALAKETGQPLLFKGNDFAQTDLTSALS
jgi:ribonuclease VapC